MWTLAGSIYAGLKWLTWWSALRLGVRATAVRSFGYLLAWPGMDARTFLTSSEARRPALPEWIGAALKTGLGALLFWGAARTVRSSPMAAGWIGLLGLIFLLHFGSFHLVSLIWRSARVDARPIMHAPAGAASLSELWGKRWNLAFHVLARDFVVGPLRRRVPPPAALLLAFLVSGLIHDLVISVPAQGGYGLPTLYFMLQGVAILAERSSLGRRLGLRGGWRGRFFAVLVAAGPAIWLFHPPFITRVIIPFMNALGAL